MPDRSTPAHTGESPAKAPSPAGDGPVLSALTSCLTAWQHADSWDRFIEALAPVEAAAVQAGHLALHDVCVALRQRIVQLSRTQASPNEEQCAVLATWPSFASAWAEVPGEPRLGELLVEFLQHPMWPQVLADDEAEHLRVMLGVESGAYGTASLLEVVIEDINSEDIDIDGRDDDDDRSDDGLGGYDGLSGYARIGAAVEGGGRIVPDVRAHMGGGDDDPGPADASGRVDSEREILDLLLHEAAELAAALADIVPLATSEIVDEDARRDALVNVAEQMERFNGAVEVLGLEGLCRVGRRFGENILALSAAGGAVTPKVAELLVRMCSAIPDYLERPAQGTASKALTSLLTHRAWPQPADARWAAEVDALLAAAVLDSEEPLVGTSDRKALPEDLSLELSHDVDRELLRGLLLDLPGQTAALSKSIEALVSGGASKDVGEAQRILHSIKGAANTIGVVGLANLTHHLEDILLSLRRQRVTPGPELGAVLMRAADCLVSMGEAVLERSTPPADALVTLQSVLDWAAIIHDEGASAKGGAPMAAAAPGMAPGGNEPEPKAKAAPPVATPMITVPAPLVDDLLRLVGETISLTGDLRERLGLPSGEAEDLRARCMRLRQLGRAMEEHLALEGPNPPRRRLLEAETIVPILRRSVDQASRGTGKAVELRCVGTDALIDSELLGRLRDPLMHVLRNAVDHGIEARATRIETGKDAAGEIRLVFQREDNHIVIRCEDDGKGLDLDAIREAALAREIIGENDRPSDEELARLVLEPDFSTRAEATRLSGRGIGLDAVNKQVLALGGSLLLQSEPGKGCRVIMRLPLTPASTEPRRCA